ncbi:MAG: hypothetical protein O7A06_12985, partial [Acidobacteria bacterium]|nr:hypothetical protein [Acidobacteriota bacterium]
SDERESRSQESEVRSQNGLQSEPRALRQAPFDFARGRLDVGSSRIYEPTSPEGKPHKFELQIYRGYLAYARGSD